MLPLERVGRSAVWVELRLARLSQPAAERQSAATTTCAAAASRAAEDVGSAVVWHAGQDPALAGQRHGLGERAVQQLPRAVHDLLPLLGFLLRPLLISQASSSSSRSVAGIEEAGRQQMRRRARRERRRRPRSLKPQRGGARRRRETIVPVVLGFALCDLGDVDGGRAAVGRAEHGMVALVHVASERKADVVLQGAREDGNAAGRNLADAAVEAKRIGLAHGGD